MSSQLPNVGSNQTGLATVPERAVELLKARDEFMYLVNPGGVHQIAEERIEYARESANGVGSLPPPRILEGDDLQDELIVLLNELGAGLAGARSITRYSDALLSKYQAYGTFEGGPTKQELEQIRTHHNAHVGVLAEIIDTLGGDPTALTPAGNRMVAISHGLTQVMSDPRINLLETLSAMLVAELTSRESWKTLQDLASVCGLSAVERHLEQGFQVEEAHVLLVRRWLAAGQLRVQRPSKH